MDEPLPQEEIALDKNEDKMEIFVHVEESRPWLTIDLAQNQLNIL